MKVSAVLTGALAILSQAVGLSSAKFRPLPNVSRLPKPPGVQAADVLDAQGYYNGTFTQPIDHFNPDLGNFTQRFWFNTKHWKGPGSPVILFMPGEEDASGYLGYMYNHTMTGLYAQEFGGMVIVIEHRYWGESLPVDILTSRTLQYLQLPQSMLDMTNFAANATFDLGNGYQNDNATMAPWILAGGSYPGALTAWIQQTHPGVFWAYHSSSGVVQTMTDFYGYFEPIANALPTNCSADVRAVVQYADYMMGNGTESEISTFKALFGLQNLENADFGNELGVIFRSWQDGAKDMEIIFEFCDYLETGIEPDTPSYTNSSTTPDGRPQVVASYPNGVGLTTALHRYARFMRETTAGETVTGSYGADAKLMNQPDDFTHMRQWEWMVCDNPFGWFQGGGGPNGSEAGGPGLMSSFVDVDFYRHICNATFPAVDGYEPGWLMGFTPEHLDLYTHGWNGQFERTIFVNGGIDPWRSATVSSDYRPGGPLQETADGTLVFVVPSGNHCPEMLLQYYPEMPTLYSDLIKQMRTFLDDWVAPS